MGKILITKYEIIVISGFVLDFRVAKVSIFVGNKEVLVAKYRFVIVVGIVLGLRVSKI